MCVNNLSRVSYVKVEWPGDELDCKSDALTNNVIDRNTKIKGFTVSPSQATLVHPGVALI